MQEREINHTGRSILDVLRSKQLHIDSKAIQYGKKFYAAGCASNNLEPTEDKFQTTR